MKTLSQFDVKGKKILVRCDFNVPLDESGNILDAFRIKQTLPTINYLIKNGAEIILMSHLDRPEGKELKFSLKPIAAKLAELLAKPVKFIDDCVGEKVAQEISRIKTGEIVLLENLRFYKEEEANDDNFAKKLAEFGDIYINDAFGASHRMHASIVGVPKYLPAGAGLLLEKEIKVLTALMENPEKPLVALIGGAKVEEKAVLIDKISKIADFVLISGLIQREIKEKNVETKYPEKIIGPKDEIDGGKDVGTESVKFYQEKINLAKTIFWNGPFGQIEKEEFSKGTEKIAKAIVASSAFSVVGGGETVEFINKLGIIDKFGHVSTGGGAMLEFLSGEKLPGIEALG